LNGEANAREKEFMGLQWRKRERESTKRGVREERGGGKKI